jgi:transcriptional regulator with XRE-family HTH domain
LTGGFATPAWLAHAEMAELLGIDRSYLSEIETGKKDPSLTVLKTIADGFHLTLSQLLRGL